MNRTMWQRGFTLAELLVVLAILAIAFALLLPALQQAREASRRVQCKSHLRQMALAIHVYHETQNRLPAAAYSPLAKNGWAWAAMILPYIEQENLFGALDLNHRPLPQAAADPSTLALLEAAIPVYQCPSDASGSGLNTERPYLALVAQRTVYLGRSNYKGCIGGDSTSGGAFVIASDPAIGFRDVTDGLAATFLIGEAMSGALRGADASQCAAVWPGGEASRSISANGGVALDAWFAVGGSCMFQLQTGKWVGGQNEPSGGFGSWHPAGANFAMCDGSARFISENIDWSDQEGSGRLYNALGSRSGGEAAGF